MDKQILLCSRCNLGPAISHEDKHISEEWKVLLTTHIKTPEQLHIGAHAESEEDKTQTETSIVPNKYTSKQRYTPYHQGWIWKKPGKKGKLKEDNLLLLYSLFA